MKMSRKIAHRLCKQKAQKIDNKYWARRYRVSGYNWVSSLYFVKSFLDEIAIQQKQELITL